MDSVMKLDIHQTILAICERLNSAGKKDVKLIMADACSALGWEHYGFVTHVVSSFTESKALLLTNYPLTWLAIYKLKNHYAIDPVVAHCLHNNLPMTWAANAELWTDFSPKIRAFMKDCRKSGWTGGVGVPVHTHHHHGVLSFTTKKPFPEMAQAIRNVHLYGHLLGVHLFEALTRTHATEPVKLSTREHEILQLVADGYNSKMIADRLQISESTIVFHITNAQKKVGARTRQELVTKAYARGLLSITIHWGDQAILNWPEVDERIAGVSSQIDNNLLN